MQTGVFPSVLKYVKVVPVFKKGKRDVYENYRPISIVSIVSKVFEVVLSRQLIAYFESNNLFTECQFGFRAKHSTVEAVLSFIRRCSEGMENGLCVGGRMFDLTKAFDTESHSVLLSAGQHSESLRNKYEQLCQQASKHGVSVLIRGGSALDAVVEATMVLEDSPLTNSGFGSNLSWNGRVECDASVMNGQNLSFGACGAVAGVKNPVVLAKHICEQQLVTLPLGRVPPSLLAGDGALRYAVEHKITTVDPDSLISAKAFKTYKQCKKRLARYDNHVSKKMKCDEESADKLQERLDTVGAVCVDAEGNIAVASSSGGVLLKREGRIGQVGIQGAGCWAEGSVGAVTTGCGEHLMSTCLAREVARNVRTSDCAVTALHATLLNDFLNSPLLRRVEEKLAGVLVVRTCEGRGELVYAHTTQSMCVGYMTTTHKKPKSRMSRLPEGSKHGRSIMIEGVCF